MLQHQGQCPRAGFSPPLRDLTCCSFFQAGFLLDFLSEQLFCDSSFMPCCQRLLKFSPHLTRLKCLEGKPWRDQESNRPYAVNPCNHSNEAKSLSLHKRKIKSSTGVDWKEIHQEMDKVNHVQLRLTLTYSGLPWRSVVLTVSFIYMGIQMHTELWQLP